VSEKTNTPPALISRVHIRVYRQSQETRRKLPAKERGSAGQQDSSGIIGQDGGREEWVV
jgi:hypothetical protein